MKLSQFVNDSGISLTSKEVSKLPTNQFTIHKGGKDDENTPEV